MTMTRRDLVRKVADNVGVTQTEVAQIVEEVLSIITRGLAEGQRWEIRGFGIFKVKTRASRVGRNPRTGGEVFVPERRVVVFKSGKKMTDAVAQSLTRQDESRTRTGGDRLSE